IQRRRQFQSAAADVRKGRFKEDDLRVPVDLDPDLVDLFSRNLNGTAEDQRFRLFPAFGEAARHQEEIKTLLRTFPAFGILGLWGLLRGQRVGPYRDQSALGPPSGGEGRGAQSLLAEIDRRAEDLLRIESEFLTEDFLASMLDELIRNADPPELRLRDPAGSPLLFQKGQDRLAESPCQRMLLQRDDFAAAIGD